MPWTQKGALTSTSSGSGGGGSAGLFAWTPGRIYTPPVFPYAVGNAISLVYGYTYFYPIRIPNACTISSISLISANGSGATAYIGLHADVPTASSKGPSGKPFGSGSVVIGAAGQSFAAPVRAVLNAPANIWLSLSTSSAAGNQQVSGTGAGYTLMNIPPNNNLNLWYSFAASGSVLSTTGFYGVPVTVDPAAYPLAVQNFGTPIFGFNITA